MLNILIPEYNALFWEQDWLATGLWNGPYYLFQYCRLMNLSENILHCQQSKSSMKIYAGMELVESVVIFKRLLQGVPVCAPTIILMIFFCKVNILLLLEEFSPQKYSILHYRVEICKINWLQCDNFADMEHQLNCVTCCT